MRTLFVFVTILFQSLLLANGQSPRSHEERVVRMAYAKLSYLTQLGAICDAAISSHGGNYVDPASLAGRLKDAELTFKIDEFRSGDISEIASVPWGDLVTIPRSSDYLLDVRTRTQTFRDRDLPQEAWMAGRAGWKTGPQYPTENLPIVAAMTVKHVIETGGQLWIQPGPVVYTRYAAFTVKAKFEDRTVGPYKAAFFFGTNAQGEEVVSPQDQITAGQALYDATARSAYPSGLMHTHLRETKVLSDWLGASAVSSPECRLGKKELCCDGAKCGVAPQDLDSEMSLSLPDTTGAQP
jgi:hypothetical protein